MKMNRKAVMESQSVHNFTKDILSMSEGKDVVGRYYDVLLAAEILKNEMDEELNYHGNH